MEFQLQHQPFNLGCCFQSKLGPMEPGCLGLDGHSGLPPSVDALVPGWLTRHGLLFPAPLPPPPQRSPGFFPNLALGAPSLQLAWLLTLEGVQAALIHPAPLYPGPHCPSAHLARLPPLLERLELLAAMVGRGLTTPPCPRRGQASMCSGPSPEPVWTERPGPQHRALRAGDPLAGGMTVSQGWRQHLVSVRRLEETPPRGWAGSRGPSPQTLLFRKRPSTDSPVRSVFPVGLLAGGFLG